MCAPRVTRHTSIRYSSSCHTRVNMGALVFFTVAKIRAYSHSEVTWQWWAVLVSPTISTWPRWSKDTDHCSSEEYRFTLVDVFGKNLNIISMCAVSPVVHTSNISSCQKIFFRFPVAMNNSIKVCPLVFVVINVCNDGEHYETPCISTASYSSFKSRRYINSTADMVLYKNQIPT
jgi:hypothetical protein